MSAAAATTGRLLGAMVGAAGVGEGLGETWALRSAAVRNRAMTGVAMDFKSTIAMLRHGGGLSKELMIDWLQRRKRMGQ